MTAERRWARPLVTKALLEADLALCLTLAEWDVLIRQARRANVLGALHDVIDSAGTLDRVPAAPRMHLTSAAAVSKRQVQATRFEVECVLSALEGLAVPVILLKGAAYVMGGMRPASGRIFTDVDLLVPPEVIREVESRLLVAGWQNGDHSEYDQRYYRRWMHEVPPLRHMRRGTILDLHHAILPPTARLQPNNLLLRQSAVAVPDYPNLYVLEPTDMILHSATHLFHEGELDNGFRDLLDIDRLLRQYASRRGFWRRLFQRASEVGLTQPIGLAVHYAHALLDTPVPEHYQACAAGTRADSSLRRSSLDFCYQRTLLPHHTSCRQRGFDIARSMLYVRSHWLRMPARLLVPHLLHKALDVTYR